MHAIEMMYTMAVAVMTLSHFHSNQEDLVYYWAGMALACNVNLGKPVIK